MVRALTPELHSCVTESGEQSSRDVPRVETRCLDRRLVLAAEAFVQRYSTINGAPHVIAAICFLGHPSFIPASSLRPRLSANAHDSLRHEKFFRWPEDCQHHFCLMDAV